MTSFFSQKWSVSPSYPSPITLGDLPNELIIQILEMLDKYHLYRICTLSKRFNELALRIVFSDVHGVNLVSNVFRVSSSYLKYLSLAFFIPRIQILVCRFDQPQILRDLHRLQSFVSRIQSIDRLELDFRSSFYGRRSWTPSSVESMKLIRDVLYAVAGADSHLVFVITPTGSTFTCSPESILSWKLTDCSYKSRLHLEVDYAIWRLLYFFSFCCCSTSKLSEPTVIFSDLATEEASQLRYDGPYRMLRMRSVSIYHIPSPLYPFTLLSFADPANSTIHLGRNHRLSSDQWSSLLSDLESNNAYAHHDTIIIQNDNIPMADVYLLLRRIPSITSLICDSCITGTLNIQTSTLPASPTSSPLSLTTISGYPPHIIDIFRSGNTFPSLSEITIRYCSLKERPDCYSLVTEALRLIGQHPMADDQSVDLTFSYENLPVEDSAEHNRWLTFDDVSGDDRVERQLYCVTCVGLASLDGKHDTSRIPKWLTLFPCLDSISLPRCHMDEDGKSDFLRRVMELADTRELSVL